jgi:hypothetical protein
MGGISPEDMGGISRPGGIIPERLARIDTAEL